MLKVIYTFIFLILSLFFTFPIFAQNNNFVSVVNPVRGGEFWSIKDQQPEDAMLGQIDILKKQNLQSTWLVRFDALANQKIVDILKGVSNDEKGLFLEVIPSWAKEAGISYHKSENWHDAGSAFLTGYEREERTKLVDAAFNKFKNAFGYYPTSVGAWWIDAFSLSYMQKKYSVVGALIVADQYSTDNYQIWGQYFSTPYYPNIKNALHPAQTMENKIPVVISQWAARDPVNGYGNGVFESTFSVQPNDYIDYHKLDINYFAKLVDIYTKQQLNNFGSLVVGLENTYEWNKYEKEYSKQINILVDKRNKNQLRIVTLSQFSDWYMTTFPQLSPQQLIVADDPLGSFKKVVWFMNPYYRAGWFLNMDGSVFRDVRQYVEGSEEICFQKRCDSVNFATFATRVLDEVTYGDKWVIDEGKISNFKVNKSEDKYIITYSNEAGKERRIDFLARDIGVDGKNSSIDGVILNTIKKDTIVEKKQTSFKVASFNWNLVSILAKIFRFVAFVLIAILIPGSVLTNQFIRRSYLTRIFLSMIVGFVLLTLLFFITSLLNLRITLLLYFLINIFFLFRLKILPSLSLPKFKKMDLAVGAIILAGIIFQNIPMFKNGLAFPFGLGFWGPNTHDGIWHISLINQAVKGLPVENPVYANTILKNYHYFYDLTVAATNYFTKISVLDLVFRFFPVSFSLLLGIGTYLLASTLFRNRWSNIFSLFFVYFAGSFGWVVDYIRNKSFGGESAFWANQSISYNLNPPFAISLLIIIAIFLIIARGSFKSKYGILVVSILTGSLIGFKAYGAILMLGVLLFLTIKNIKRDLSFFYIFITSSFFTSLIFLSQFQFNQQLVIFAPFWFIHSMIDAPDRVGWTRLALTRQTGLQGNNWFKFISAETVSLAIFIFGNLGTRAIALLSVLKIKSNLKKDAHLLILVFSLLSFLVPILFIQAGNPWNTIQFIYYGLYTAALTSGLVLSLVFSNLPKIVSFLLLSTILVLTPINSITTATYYTGYLPHGRIDNQELEALDYLSKMENGTVLTYPYEERLKQTVSEPWPLYVYDSTAYVSALSRNPVYLEDEAQNQILLTDYKKRLVASKDFFLKPHKEFLKQNNIKYIYLPKIHNAKLDLSFIKVIFENPEVVIYKVD